MKRPAKQPAKKPPPRTRARTAKQRSAATRAKRPNRPNRTKRASPAQARGPKREAPRAFVERLGIVLATAQGPIPSVAEAVAGEPIVGSWWAHARSQAIFDALSELDDSPDIRCFRLVDGKVTFVHRRLWPALVRLVRDGVFTADRVASVQQEHAPTGEHHNIVTPYPDWVDEATAVAADKLTTAKARHALGLWA